MVVLVPRSGSICSICVTFVQLLPSHSKATVSSRRNDRFLKNMSFRLDETTVTRPTIDRHMANRSFRLDETIGFEENDRFVSTKRPPTDIPPGERSSTPGPRNLNENLALEELSGTLRLCATTYGGWKAACENWFCSGCFLCQSSSQFGKIEFNADASPPQVEVELNIAGDPSSDHKQLFFFVMLFVCTCLALRTHNYVSTTSACHLHNVGVLTSTPVRPTYLDNTAQASCGAPSPRARGAQSDNFRVFV